MQVIDTGYLLDNYSKYFKEINPTQKAGIEFLSDEFSKSNIFDTKAKISYALATVYHETAFTFQPVREIGKGKNKKYGQIYYGRGYIQLTWKDNYIKFSKLLGIDLVNYPDLALEKLNAFRIMELGMGYGTFTGKKLNDYFNGEDYNFGITEINNKKTSPRQIINGLDRAEQIGKYADNFFSLINFKNI